MPIFNPIAVGGASQPDFVEVKINSSGPNASVTYNDGHSIVSTDISWSPTSATVTTINCPKNSIIYISGHFYTGGDIIRITSGEAVVAAHYVENDTSIPVLVLGNCRLLVAKVDMSGG